MLARATVTTKDSLYRFRPRRGRGSSLRAYVSISASIITT